MYATGKNKFCCDGSATLPIIHPEDKPHVVFDGADLIVKVLLSSLCAVCRRVRWQESIRIAQPIYGELLWRMNNHIEDGDRLNFVVKRAVATGSAPFGVWLEIEIALSCSCRTGDLSPGYHSVRIAQHVPPAIFDPSLPSRAIAQAVSEEIPEEIWSWPDYLSPEQQDQVHKPLNRAMYSLASARVLAPIRRWEKVSGKPPLATERERLSTTATTRAYDRVIGIQDARQDIDTYIYLYEDFDGVDYEPDDYDVK